MFHKKYRRAQFGVSLFVITCLLIIKDAEAGRDRGARCEKPDYVPNGSYRIRRDRVMKINCNPGFILQGSKTIDCVRGKWDGEKPVCAKKGCKKDLEQPENGRIQIENEVKAILYCSDNFNLAGNRYSYCNGSHWDRPIGNCRVHRNIVQHECDFETDDICGWTYEPREGLEWKRVMAANVFTTFKTGPRHDHTTLTANGGHYMLMESLTKQNDDVTLISPIYDRELSLKTACCFQFYYFMYGAGVGNLFVIVKPVSLDLDEVQKNHKDLIKFQKYGNQNNIWNEAHFNIEELDEDFQILFVATSGHGQLSDIAVDDVKLLTGDSCRALNTKADEDFSNEEYDSTTYESIFEMQSCVGQCFKSPGSGIIRKFKYLQGLCNCDVDCEDNETCCPDFRAVCLNELFSASTNFVEASEARDHKETSTTPTPIPRGSITTTTIQPKTTIAKTTPTTTKATFSTTTTSRPKTTRTFTTRTTTPTTTTRSTLPRIATTTTTAKPKTTTTFTTPTTTLRTTTRITTTRTTTKTTLPTTSTSKPKTTKSTTMRTTTPTTTSRNTSPKTTTTTSTARPKPTRTLTTRRTTATTTTRNTTPRTTTRKTTSTQKPTPTTTTTQKTTQTTPSTTPVRSTAAKNSPDPTSTRRPPPPTSKSIEYIINDKSKTKAKTTEFSSWLWYTFFLIIVLVLAGAAYKRFGDTAVAWYMIQFKHNTAGDEDRSSVTSTFKRPEPQTNGTNGNAKTKSRNKLKKASNTTNSMKARLIEDDDDEDDEMGTKDNIALKNHIYTEL